MGFALWVVPKDIRHDIVVLVVSLIKIFSHVNLKFKKFFL